MILASLDIPLIAHYALRTSPIGSWSTPQTKASPMSVTPDPQHVSLMLPEHTVMQLDELIRHGHFVNRQEVVVAAVDRLYADEETRHLTTRQKAFARLCGALHLGTTQESLRQAELDRLAWESQHRLS